MDCSNHPGTASTDTCIACSQPICAECREEVAGHPMCQSCVTAAQDRLAAADTTAPNVSSPTITTDAPVTFEPVAPCGSAGYVKAVLFGVVAAVIGAVLWYQFVQITGWLVGIIAVALGALVGVAVRAGAQGRPGEMLPWIGALLAAFSILLGYAFIYQDSLVRTVQNLSLMSWVMVAIGVWEGWSIPHRSNQEAQMAATPPTAAAPAPASPGPDNPQQTETPQH